MSDKKRKSTSKDGERPSKKIQSGSSVKVNHVAGPDIAKPVMAFSPGVQFPKIKFKSFSKQGAGKTHLLLHSSEHTTLDHLAREDDNSVENHLKHYVAVFDPESGKLQVTEAKRLTVRSTLRSAISSREEDGDSGKPTNYGLRSDLTAAFGTKKSKKAAQSAEENRLLAQGSEAANKPISAALIAEIDQDEDIDNKVSLSDALGNKPLPIANLYTNEIDQVYAIDTLVQPYPADGTLEAMPTKTWIERISAKKEVKTRSRFVAGRVGYLVFKLLDTPNASDPELTKALQVLRYIELLIELHTYTSRLQRRRQIPRVDEWPDKTLSDGTPSSLIRPIVNHFFPSRMPTENSITLLQTTILALALHIPPPSSKTVKNELAIEPTDISMDLALDVDKAKKLFRELGCRVAPATETELETWKLQKVSKKKDAAGGSLPKPQFAKLKFPLDFPKLSRGRPQGKK